MATVVEILTFLNHSNIALLETLSAQQDLLQSSQTVDSANHLRGFKELQGNQDLDQRNYANGMGYI